MKTLEISSTQNDIVKFAVRLQDSKFRKEQKLILVDGEKTINGLMADGVVFEYLFIEKDDVKKRYSNIENLVFVNSEILKKISTTKTPTSSVAIIKEPLVSESDFLKLNKIILLDGVKDAGNLGTIIRSAVAFSVDGIILFNDCVDLYNSKVVRSTAQNMFKIPVISTKSIDFLLKLKKTHKIFATSLDAQQEFIDCVFPEKYILAMGSEASGISDKLDAIADTKLKMTMDNDVESLNLAICTSICLALIKFKSKL